MATSQTTPARTVEMKLGEEEAKVQEEIRDNLEDMKNVIPIFERIAEALERVSTTLENISTDTRDISHMMQEQQQHKGLSDDQLNVILARLTAYQSVATASMYNPFISTGYPAGSPMIPGTQPSTPSTVPPIPVTKIQSPMVAEALRLRAEMEKMTEAEQRESFWEWMKKKANIE